MSSLSPPGPRLNYVFLWSVCLVAAMGGLLFGYDWVVIGGAKPFYELYFGIVGDHWAQGFAMSSALIGCLMGAIVSGAVSDRYGRKRPLIVAAVLFTISGVWTALASDLTTFNLARWIGGVGIGLASTLSPTYIAEISPGHLRGRLVSINQLTVVLGILAAQIVNWAIARGAPPEAASPELLQSWYGQTGWRWMFAAETVPAFAFFLLMFAVPESPRWLAKAGRLDAAEKVLGRVGESEYARREMAAIRETLGREPEGHGGFRDLFGPGVSRILVLGVTLAVLQQWCGINVIFNYAQEIFQAAGYNVSGVMQSIVITGIVNVVFTFVSIACVDRFGRRKLMLLGSAGLAIIYTALGSAYYAGQTGPLMVALVVSAIAVYAVSLASVTWVIIAEIFPNRIRGAAVAVSVLALWMACTVLTFTFPFLNRGLGPHGTFWLYAAICLAGWVFIWMRLPETKGKSLEQIEQELMRDASGAKAAPQMIVV
jgi:sugar porter (SP) family MFS transporter